MSLSVRSISKVTMAALLVLLLAPKIAKVMRSSAEGAAQGRLGLVREALSRYHQDTGGYPAGLEALAQGGKYLEAVPSASAPPYHKDSSRSRLGAVTDDDGGWLYDGKGGLWVNCTHTDTKLRRWDSY